jgi:hypothetical protein
LSPTKEYRTPPLAFEVREGIRVAIVTHKRIQNPSTCVWSEGGDGGGCCCPERIPEPPTHVWSKGGGGGSHCHPEKNPRSPCLHLQQGRGSLLLLLPSTQEHCPPCLHLQQGRGSSLSLPIKEKPPLLMFAARGLLLSLSSHCHCC